MSYVIAVSFTNKKVTKDDFEVGGKGLEINLGREEGDKEDYHLYIPGFVVQSEQELRDAIERVIKEKKKYE